MALKIAGRLFTGPYDPSGFVVRANQEPVVYAVVAKEGDAWDPRFRLIAVDAGCEGEDLVFASHTDLNHWQEEADGKIAVYVHPLGARAGATAADRAALVAAIVAAVPPPNGIIPS